MRAASVASSEAFTPSPEIDIPVVAWEQRPRYTHAGQVGRGGVPIGGHVPVDDKRVGELVSQETKTWNLDGESEPDWFNIHDVNFQQIARFSTFDERRPGERVNHAQIYRGDLFGPRLGSHLTIQTVPRFQDDAIAWRGMDDRRNVRMPPVVAGLGLFSKRFGAVSRYPMDVTSNSQAAPSETVTTVVASVQPLDATDSLHPGKSDAPRLVNQW